MCHIPVTTFPLALPLAALTVRLSLLQCPRTFPPPHPPRLSPCLRRASALGSRAVKRLFYGMNDAGADRAISRSISQPLPRLFGPGEVLEQE